MDGNQGNFGAKLENILDIFDTLLFKINFVHTYAIRVSKLTCVASTQEATTR